MTEADVARHNARVSKENKIPVVETPAAGSEAELHDRIVEECKHRGWIPLCGSMAHRTFRNPGEWDFEVIADRGRTFHIEVKTRTGKLSPAQAALHHHAAHLGHTVHVVRSFEGFLQVVDGGLL